MLREMWAQAPRAWPPPRWTDGGLVATVATPTRRRRPGGPAAGCVVDAPTPRRCDGGRRTGDARSRRAAGGRRRMATCAGNLAVLLDIDLPLVVRFARTELSLKALTALGPGSMVDMGRVARGSGAGAGRRSRHRRRRSRGRRRQLRRADLERASRPADRMRAMEGTRVTHDDDDRPSSVGRGAAAPPVAQLWRDDPPAARGGRRIATARPRHSSC